MRSLVANGFGYSVANVRPLNDLSPDGKPLKFVPLGGDRRPLQLGLLHASEARNLHVIRAFIQHCVDARTLDAMQALTMARNDPQVSA